MKEREAWRIPGAAALLLAGAALCVAAPPAQPSSPKPADKTAAVPENERLEFTQKNAQAQMQELQDRMFHLAELTRDAEPDNSTRLLLAVRKAREQLIMEQMKEVLDRLASRELGPASDESKVILAKLEDLRNLLIATDLDLQLQLERLRQLNGAIRTLDHAIKEEKQEQSRSGELAKLPGAKPADLDQAKTDQQSNHKRTDEVADTAKALGDLDSALQSLGAAGQSMSKAEGNLGGGNPGEASPEQGEAAGQMADARNAIEAQRQKVLREVQNQIKRVVMDNLQQMLERQSGVDTATAALSPRLNKERAAVMQLQQLGQPEQRIAALCQQTLELVNETEFSFALPPALDNLHRNMLYVAGDLAGGRGDERVMATQTGIEQDLRELIDTFKELEKKNEQQGKPGQSGRARQNQNKLAAELKVLRMLQVRVNQGTLDADADAHRAAAAADLPPELRDKIGRVRDGEDAIRDAMEMLHDRFGPNAPQTPEDGNDPNTV